MTHEVPMEFATSVEQPVQGRGSRAWVFTDFSLDSDALDKTNCRYIVYGDEIAPTTGRRHYQGFVYFDNVIGRATVQERLGVGKCWCNPMYSTPDACIKYCKKDGSSVERGDRPAQGKKCNKEDVKDYAMAGKSIRHVLDDSQASMHSIRTIETMYKYYEKERNWKPEIYWFWGGPEAGKSRYAREHAESKYGAGCVYTATETGKWFDGYDAHEVIVVDDFRESWVPWPALLQLTDRYGYRLPIKGNFRQCLAKAIYFTCVHHPKDAFPSLSYSEPITQFLRRLTHVRELRHEPGEELTIEKCLKDKEYILNCSNGVLSAKVDENTQATIQEEGGQVNQGSEVSDSQG